MKFGKKSAFVGVSLCALMAGGVAAPAYAQDAETRAEEDDGNVIIVTARKKEEELIDAPLAVSVFGQEELEDAAYKDITEVTKAAPGVFVEPNNDLFARINTTPRFRGVSFASGNRLAQTATVFLDGIYLSGGLQTLGLNELQRVEIIKGPQSALFGRNTFSGAINYVTKDPSDEFRADINVSGATRDDYSVSLGVEGPIMDGLSFRLSGNYNDKQGHYANVTVPGQNLGDESQWNISGTLLIEPTSSVRLKLRGSYQEIDDGPAAAIAAFGTASHNFGGFLRGPGGTVDQTSSVIPAPRDIIPGTVFLRGYLTNTESVYRGRIDIDSIDPARFGNNSSMADALALRDALVNDARWDPANAAFLDFKYNPLNVDDFGLNLDSLRLSADLQVDLTDNIQFVFLGGYNKENFGYYADFDLTPDASFSSFIARETTDYTLEGRLSGSFLDDTLFIKVGASYVDLDILDLAGTANLVGAAPSFFPDAFRATPFVTGAKTTGIFGSLDYEFTEQLTITLEARYQWDEIIQDEVNFGPTSSVMSPTTFTSFLPRATLRYEPSDDTTLYLTYSEGNLPGGFNPQVSDLTVPQRTELAILAPDAQETFNEEKLTNYEFGWKQRFADGNIAFNLAAFYMERSDELFRSIEVVTGPPPTNQITVGYTGNGATTEIYGVEFDMFAQVSDNFSVQGSFGYVDAKIASFPAGAGTGDFGDIFGEAASIVGQEAPRFPPITISLGGTYEDDVDFAGFDSWYLRGDSFFTSGFYVSNANVAKTKEAMDVNLRLGLRGEDMGIEFFVTNLFNEDAPAAAQNFADTSFDTRFGVTGGFFDFTREGVRIGLRDKRQFGVRMNYTFR